MSRGEEGFAQMVQGGGEGDLMVVVVVVVGKGCIFWVLVISFFCV